MVGTRPKNQLGKIPTGTKIDLTNSPPKRPPQPKRKAMASPSDNPETTAEPSSPAKATSAEIDTTIDALAPSPPLKVPANKGQKKAKAVKEKAQEAEAETVASSSGDHNVEGEETSDARAKPAAEEDEEQNEEGRPAGEVEILEEEIPEEEEAQEREEQDEEEEYEEEKGSEATTTEKQSSSDVPVTKKRTRSESRLAIVASTPKRRALASADKPPRSSPLPSLREIVKSKVYDWELLETLGVAKAVRGYFKAIGWEGFLAWKGTIYPALAREFIQSLNAKSPPQDQTDHELHLLQAQ